MSTMSHKRSTASDFLCQVVGRQCYDVTIIPLSKQQRKPNRTKDWLIIVTPYGRGSFLKITKKGGIQLCTGELGNIWEKRNALALAVSATMWLSVLNGANEGGPNGRRVVQLVSQLTRGIISLDNEKRGYTSSDWGAEDIRKGRLCVRYIPFVLRYHHECHWKRKCYPWRLRPRHRIVPF